MKKAIFKIILSVFPLVVSCNQSTESEPEAFLDFGPVLTSPPIASNGTNWNAISKFPEVPNKAHINILYDMAIEGTQIYCASNHEGVYRTINNQNEWEQINTGLIKTSGELPYNVFRVSAIESLSGKMFCASSNINNEVGIYVLNKATNSWGSKIKWNSKGEVYSLIAAKNGYLFAGLSEENEYSIWLSVDKGENWKNISGNLKESPTGHIYSFAFNKNEIYIGTVTGIFLTKNLGERWERVFFPYSEVNTITIDGLGNFYASTRNKAFLKKKGEENWIEIFSVPSGRNVNKLFIGSNNTLFLACCDGVWRSTDYGNTLLKVGLDNLLPVRFVFSSTGDLFTATKRSGVFVSPK